MSIWERRVRRKRSPLGGTRSSPTSIIRHQSSVINSNGFTLIELLVVIAAIALLMAILLPALNLARKQAKAVVCQSRLRQWGTILASYAQDNDGHFPCSLAGDAGVWLLWGTVLNVHNKDPNAPQDSLYHFRTEKIACCPLGTRPYPGTDPRAGLPIPVPTSINVGPVSFFLGSADLSNPAWKIDFPAPGFVGSYGLNRFVFRPHFQSTLTFVPPAELTQGADIFSLPGQANIPVVLDSAAPYGGPPSANEPPPRDLRSHSFSWPFCVERHGGFVNGVFLDWSVRKIGLKELWKLKWFRDFDTNGPWTKAGGVQPEDWPEWMRKARDY